LAKDKIRYKCSECNEIHIRWMGQCSHCQAWNSLEETTVSKEQEKNKPNIKISKLENTFDISIDNEQRASSGLSEIDNLLGGGIVRGSVILLGGEPGVGKSTLLLEIAKSKQSILYISGEESQAQVFNRAKRLNAVSKNLKILSENHLSVILKYIEEEKPDLIFIDSIQTIYNDESRGFTGSIGQIRESAQAFLEVAKKESISFIITGHITKDGQIAGPKLLEHAVDVVLYFESYRSGEFRFIRAIKNRFGPTGDIAILEMTESGLKEVNPEKSLISMADTGGIGSVIFPQIEGTRVVPLEVQVLVTPTGFANGRRIGENIDISRIHLISAILEKYLNYKLSQCDIFVRVQGGTSLRDTGGDLALLIAMASSYLEKEVPRKSIIAGELSLTGKIRKPSHIKLRKKSAKLLQANRHIWGGEKEDTEGEYFQDIKICINSIFG